MLGRMFGPELFQFLRDLRENNDRDWFQQNRDRYERDVKAPLVDFIAAFAPRLHAISGHFVADPRRSMFRIHRDTRFATDKSPYKTHAAAQFRHEAGKDAHAPGFYLHLEPGEVFAGFGLWRPDSNTLGRIRDRMVEDPDAWTGVVEDPAFRARFTVHGEQLTRPPRGYPKDHPLIEDLKRKDFIVSTTFGEADATEPGFLAAFEAEARAASPFMAYLTTAVGLPY